MHLPSLALTLLPTLITACTPPPSTNSSQAFQLGSDGPADPATLGYSINHLSLLVNNITASLHFYSEILGMRHVFTFHATPTYQIVYLSHSQGGRNGTGFQTGEALFAQKTNTEGLIELIYHDRANSRSSSCGNATDTDRIPSTTQRVSTFSHIGLMVPDLEAIQARMEAYGVRILKRVGEDFARGSGEEVEGSRAFGYGEDVGAARAAVRQLAGLGFRRFLIVVDPDGNALEIQPQF